MEEEKSEGKTIITKIQKLLLNCDLTIVWCKGEISILSNVMKRYEHDNRKYAQRRFISAKVDKERFEIMVDDIENTKKEIVDNLDVVLSKYQQVYRDVFMKHYIEGKTYLEISKELNYSKEAIKWMARRLRDDLITIFYD